MKISAITVDSFKRIEHVDLAVDADKVLVLIGGKNANGKSSLLDALTAAFGGKSALPSDPVKHGADAAEIRVELDGGALTVRRTISAGGESQLEVRDADGKLRSPQGALDKLIGARFLDPLAFLQMSPADQRKALLAVIDRDGKIAKLDERRTRVFDRRTEVGRDHRKAQAELERLPEVTPAEPIDVAQVVAEQGKVAARRGELSAARSQLSRDEQTLAHCEREVAELEAELARIADKLEAAEVSRATMRTAVEEAKALVAQVELEAEGIDKKHAELQAKIQKATEHNKAVAVDAAAAKRRAEVAAEVARLAGGLETLTAEVEKIDTEKRTFLESTPLPVKGLDVDSAGVKFNDVPLAQASGAEQLRVALALAIAASPNLHDVWVRDGSLLDDEAMAALAREAEAAGVRVWLERVGDRDPGAIIIHDGRVREQLAKAG